MHIIQFLKDFFFASIELLRAFELPSVFLDQGYFFAVRLVYLELCGYLKSYILPSVFFSHARRVFFLGKMSGKLDSFLK